MMNPTQRMPEAYRYHVIRIDNDGRRWGIYDRHMKGLCSLPVDDGEHALTVPLEWGSRAGAEAWLFACRVSWHSGLVPAPRAWDRPAPTPPSRNPAFMRRVNIEYTYKDADRQMHMAWGTCDIEDVPKELRKVQTLLPIKTVEALRLGLTAQLPEAMRTGTRWEFAKGDFLLIVTRRADG